MIEFFKFCIIGGVTALVYFIIFTASYFLKINYLISTTLAYFISIILQFNLNKKITFKNNIIDNKFKSFYKYITMLFINYSVTIFVVWCCVEIINIHAYFGVWIALIFTVPIGFIFSKFWIYK